MTARKEDLKYDGRHLWDDLKSIYPLAFRQIRNHRLITALSAAVILFSFYADEYVRDFFAGIKHIQVLDSIFSFGHWFGNGGPTLYLFVLLYLAGIVFSYNKMRRAGLMIGEAFIFSGLVTLIIKSFFGRWRPYTNHGEASFFWFTLGPNDHLSLPSGHATVAFALSSVLAGSTKNVFLKAFFYLLAAITALSRIYHDQHWLSDVLLAAAIGIAIGNALVKLNTQRTVGNRLSAHLIDREI